MTAVRLRLDVLPGRFAVCRLGARDPLPAALLHAAPAAIVRTNDELSIVCAEELAPAHARREGGWRCLRVAGPLPFSATGILASLATPLAEAGVSLFAVSTFDTDYVLVQAAHLERALTALTSAGHEIDPRVDEAHDGVPRR